VLILSDDCVGTKEPVHNRLTVRGDLGNSPTEGEVSHTIVRCDRTGRIHQRMDVRVQELVTTVSGAKAQGVAIDHFTAVTLPPGSSLRPVVVKVVSACLNRQKKAARHVTDGVTLR